MTSEFFLAAPGGAVSDAFISPMLPARLDYHLSPQLQLMRAGDGTGIQGGIMILADTVCTAHPSAAAALCRQILNECRVHHFSGVVADFSSPAQEPLRQVLRQLWPLLQREEKLLFVTPGYALDVPQAKVLLPVQFRDGSFHAHLEEYQRQWGDRAALDLTRMCHDYPLHQGNPVALSQEDLRRLRVRFRPMCFYSRELYSNYFTYREGRELHYVLYDEETTLYTKLLAANSMGFSHIFLLYQEIEDLFTPLLRSLRGSSTMQ